MLRSSRFSAIDLVVTCCISDSNDITYDDGIAFSNESHSLHLEIAVRIWSNSYVTSVTVGHLIYGNSVVGILLKLSNLL